MSQADRYKSQGNAALAAGNYSDAIELYTKAIGLEPSEPVYFSNRAAAYAALKRWQSALDDSQEVVTLKPDWVKGWIRRGAAFTGLGKHEEARKAYLKATQLEPGNSQVEGYLKAAEQAAKDDKEKKWEDDLWSDDEEGAPAPASSNGGGGAGASGATKRAAPEAAADEEAMAVAPPKKARRKPDATLVAQLDRSLKDASEDSLRACLGQLAMADEEVCQRVLHVLEGLNAASSAGEDDDEDGDGGGGAADWLKGAGGGGGGSRDLNKRTRQPKRGRGGGGGGGGGDDDYDDSD